jgi:hypothetical protein
MPEQNGNAMNDKIRKVLFNEISLFIAITGVVLGAVLHVTGMDASVRQDVALIQKDISVIRTNELEHIASDIQFLKGCVENNEQSIGLLDKKVDRILFVLESSR